MKKIIILLCLISSNAFAFDVEHSFKCDSVGDGIQRCENKEVFCYIYDSGWAGFMKSGRGAGISCIKK